MLQFIVQHANIFCLANIQANTGLNKMQTYSFIKKNY